MIRGNEKQCVTIRDPIKMPRIDNRWMSGPFRSPTTSMILTSCVAAVSLDDDLVDALIGSITGHIISFKAFHHRCHYLQTIYDHDDRINFRLSVLHFTVVTSVQLSKQYWTVCRLARRPQQFIPRSFNSSCSIHSLQSIFYYAALRNFYQMIYDT